jgi:predicted LPLAT superfamily acyltransferase
MVLRHIYEFAVNLYDRTLVWSGAIDRMSLLHDGSGELFGLASSGRGALLLGAHLGNFDMLWLVSQKYRLVINVVAFFGNAERINAFLKTSDSDANVRVIDLDPGSVSAIFEIRSCIERGEFVVILADRLPPGATTRVAEATFLGAPARFPLAPFLLPGVLGCPVYFTLCARRGDAQYETVLRSLAPVERVARRDREKHAQELVEAYVSQLENFCVELPYQWFNFYDFWDAGR